MKDGVCGSLVYSPFPVLYSSSDEVTVIGGNMTDHKLLPVTFSLQHWNTGTANKYNIEIINALDLLK